MRILKTTAIVFGIIFNLLALYRIQYLSDYLRDNLTVNHGGAIQWLASATTLLISGAACLLLGALLPQRERV